MRKPFFFTLCMMMLSAIFINGCGKSPPASIPWQDNSTTAPSNFIQSVITGAKAKNNASEADKTLLDYVDRSTSRFDVIALANAAYGTKSRDEILLRGIPACKNVSEVICLAQNCKSTESHDNVLLNGFAVCASADDFVNLAKACQIGSNRDRILLKGASIYKSKEDLEGFAKLCISSSSREQILQNSGNLHQSSQNKLSEAYEAMREAYAAYQKGIMDGKKGSLIKPLADNYNQKKAIYDALLKKQ